MTNNSKAKTGGLVAVIGTFDGVHRGHRYLIDQALDYYKNYTADPYGDSGIKSDLRCGVITFDRHPASVLRPGLEPLQLTDLEEKINLLMDTGIDEMWVIKFDMHTSQLTAREFVTDILLDKLGVSALFVGENFRFGYRAAGDVQLLTQLGEELGFHFGHVPLLMDETLRMTISSTSIRTLISSGDISEANRLLGRSYKIKVFPYATADDSIICRCSFAPALPAFGSYAGSLSLTEAILEGTKADSENVDVPGNNLIYISRDSFFKKAPKKGAGAGVSFDNLKVTPIPSGSWSGYELILGKQIPISSDPDYTDIQDGLAENEAQGDTATSDNFQAGFGLNNYKFIRIDNLRTDAMSELKKVVFTADGQLRNGFESFVELKHRLS